MRYHITQKNLVLRITLMETAQTINSAVKYPTVVIPAPHQVRDKLQRESRKHWMPDQVRHDRVWLLIRAGVDIISGKAASNKIRNEFYYGY